MQLPIANNKTTSLRRDDVSDDQWFDWRWQARNMLTCAEDLAQFVTLSDDEHRGLARSEGRFRVGMTPYYADLMDPLHASCPIRMQAIPSPQEFDVAPWELRDPLGEDHNSPAPSVFHKYPDRCLLYVFDRCAIYCRHCNRRRIVGGETPPSKSDVDLGIDYIANTPRIRDVLISGGDPLLLSTSRLDNILGRIAAIDHVDTIRIGTRVPVVLPMRIDDELASVLRKHAPVFVNTHFNHPVELTPESRSACERLVDHGIPVGNQAVLLRGINSSVQCLRALMRGLLKSRVRPYYLFQGDNAEGTDHLRTPVEESIRLMDGLRGWMTSMGVPHMAIDIPGGGGKIPFGPNYILDVNDVRVRVRNYRGDEFEYPQPREHDCAVLYDEVFFADTPPDDDREGSA